jgi:hypothetical protein
MQQEEVVEAVAREVVVEAVDQVVSVEDQVVSVEDQVDIGVEVNQVHCKFLVFLL